MKIKLVLSGSGLLYPCHAGAVMRLAEAGYEIEAVCGVSGGAIIAAALATGYRANADLVKLIKQTLPEKNGLVDVSFWTLLTKWGLIKGEKIEQMFERYFAKQMGEAKIPLHIVTTNISREEQQIFSSVSHPQMSIAQAVRASMSIPLVFAPVKIGDDIFVDGGWVSNYPVDVFGNEPNVIGLRFATDYKKARKISSVKDYLPALINTAIEANMADDMTEAPKTNTIVLRTRQNNLNFGILDADVDQMVRDGWNCADLALKAGKIRIS